MAFSGEKLRQMREDRKMSQWDVARPMGIRPQYVSRWENGRSAPNGENMVKLINVLMCELEDITT